MYSTCHGWHGNDSRSLNHISEIETGCYMNTDKILLDRHQMSDRCGCMAKLDGISLGRVLADAFESVPEAVGPAPPLEDCAVMPAIAGRVLGSVDFGPPVSPDPRQSGRIAAAHGLSDVYAMGGVPLGVLAMLIIDPEQPEHAGTRMLEGIVAQCASEDVKVLGGHTIVGQEALIGICVIGGAGNSLLEKHGAKPGEQLLLSKPLGTGLVMRAYRHGVLGLEDTEPAMRAMETSNRAASRSAVEAGVRTATDVTGYGLLGHLAEMIGPAGVGATVRLASVPVLEVAAGLPTAFAHSRWIEANFDYCRSLTRLTGASDRARTAPLLDPQTSGGLLLAAHPDSVEQLLRAGFLHIGSITEKPGLEITP
jgi:selenide, water dikinase